MSEDAWIHRLNVALQVVQGPLLLWVQDAHLAQLGTLLRKLQAGRETILVERDRNAVDRLPPKSTFVLIPRPGDAAWLNQRRPILTARSLRVILWTDPEVTAEMASEAVDFVDWTTRTVLCPEGPPSFVFTAVRAALCARLPVIPYAGAHLKAVLARLLPGRPLVTLPFTRNYEQLVEHLSKLRGEWIVLPGLPDRFQFRRLLWAMGEVGLRGRIFLENPGPNALPWVIDERVVDLDDALSKLVAHQVPRPGRCVALLDAEPEAINAAVAALDQGLPSSELEALLERSDDPGSALGEYISSASPILRRHFERVSDTAHHTILDWARLDAPQRATLAFNLQDNDVAARWIAQCSPTNESEFTQQLDLSAQIDIFQARWTNARQKLERSLAIKEKVFGTQEHPSVAASLHALADVLRAQGDLGGARQLLDRALAIQEKVLGTQEHPSIAASLHSLAGVLLAQGDINGARQKLERSLAIDEKVFGTQEHPGVAASLHSLAGVLRAQGDLNGARQLLERSLAIKEKVFGTQEHLSVAASLHSLAALLEAEEQPEKSAEMYRRVLGIERKCLGSLDQYHSAETEVALARVLLSTGQREEAEALLAHARRVLEEQVPGHPLLSHLRDEATR